MILAAVVLVWAFAEEIPGSTTAAHGLPRRRSAPGHRRARTRHARRRTRKPPWRQPPSGELPRTIRLCSARCLSATGRDKRSGSAKLGTGTLPALRARREGRGAGHLAWLALQRMAQLSGTTYALMEQPDNRRSNFLKEGDHLEDARVIVIGPDEDRFAGGNGRRGAREACGRDGRAPAGDAALPGSAGPGRRAPPRRAAGRYWRCRAAIPRPRPGALGGSSAAFPGPAAVPDGIDNRREQRRRLRQG